MNSRRATLAKLSFSLAAALPRVLCSQASSSNPQLRFSSLPPSAGETKQLAELEKVTTGGRYMENGNGTAVTEPLSLEWEPFRAMLRRHRYTKDRFDAYRPGTGSRAKTYNAMSFEVITFSPDGKRAAKWVMAAVKAARNGNYDHESGLQYAYLVRLQSGFQFPVRGLVFELMGPGREVFTFVDGVAACLSGVERQSVPVHDESKRYLRDGTSRALALSELDKIADPTGQAYLALHSKLFAASPEVSEYGIFGRVGSFARDFGEDGESFRNRIRAAHLQAMASDEHKLLNSKLRALPADEGPMAASILRANAASLGASVDSLGEGLRKLLL